MKSFQPTLTIFSFRGIYHTESKSARNMYQVKFLRLGLLFSLLFFTTLIFGQTTITSRVSSGNDDAEERVSNGNMSLGSTDLELVEDGSNNQYVGIRFQNLNIPQGTTIISASIQFTVDETDSGNTSVQIWGQANDNAPTFNGSNGNISNRARTASSVNWNNIPNWNTVGQAGANQRTPDLTSIVQEIVNRGGWTAGNAMAFIIEGTGERTAESYNGSRSRAPVLTIVADFNLDPLPNIIANPNRGLPFIYFMADNRSELYSVAPDPTASPLPSPTIINTTFGGNPITFSGEGGGYRSTDRMVYVFDGGGEPTNSSDLYVIDPNTGVASLIRSNIVPGHVEGAEFWINNVTGEEVMFVLYENGTSGGPDRLVALNPNANGSIPAWSPYAGYPIVLSGARTRGDGISWNPDTAEFYIQNDDNVDYYTIDILTGVTSFAYSTNLAVDGEGITYASDGTNYIEDEGQAGQGRTIFEVNTTTGVLTPAAQLGSTGDVESIMGNLGVRNDAGDAPSSYGYAAHILPVLTATPTTIYLGTVAPDSENPFANFSIGNSDDNAGDDEDGVMSNGSALDGQLFSVNTSKTLNITTNGAGVLNAWIDFNRDGDFDDTGEQVATDISPTGGVITLNVAVPAAAIPGISYARFRFSSETGLTPGNSEAADGEVEDYQIIINDPTSCPAGTAVVNSQIERHVYATAVIVDRSVNNEDNALGNDDFTVAILDDEDDELILEMGELISAGSPVTINGVSGSGISMDAWVSSSATGPWTRIANADPLDHTFTSPIDWQYIRIRNEDDNEDLEISYIDATLTGVVTTCETDTDGDNVADLEDLDDDNDGVPDIAESNGYEPDGDEDGDGIMNYLDTTDDGNAGDGSTTDYTDTNSDGIPDVYDTDGDGVPNHLDLDADNDGILDAAEAGHGETHTNGVISGPYGANGLANSVETALESGIINYTISESSDDTDTIANFLDLDSDGDGIPDNVEAQTTLGYTAPSGTVAANGVFTNYTSGLTPTNTDGTDNPDYLDTDSDNEGGNDTTEAGITLSNTDTDNDGLDDSTDATNGYADPGGTIDDPLSGAVILPDLDTDALTGGDVNFRDATDDRLDTDGDGIFDTVDIDDDNDGIPDRDEHADCYGSHASGNVFNEDFGAGNRTSTPYTNYIYEPRDYPNDGQSVNDGEYAIVNDIASSASWAPTVWVNNSDHTGDPNGRMALFNSTNSALEEFYNRNNINVTPNTDQEFSFWVLNLDLASTSNTRSLPNITVYIQDNAGTTTLATFSTGSVTKDEQWHNYKFTFNPASNAQIRMVLINNAIGGLGNDLALDDIQINILCDTDGDGIINSLDLDSDNDGILDVVEAGHNRPQTNGVLNGNPSDFGNNGLLNTIETNDSSDANINYTIDESPADTDAIPNFLDLDSDGDGIPDNVEAQTTLAYTAPSGTVDANGVFTNYTSGLIPTNTDGTDNPDYLDTDSDNEGLNDTLEARINLSGNDVDNDGLDDVTDEDLSGYPDPGGTIDNPLSGSVILFDADNDANSGGDVDFRDANTICSTGPGIIVNEISNGTGGSREWIELLVVGDAASPSAPVDLTGWIIDDNNGDFEGGVGTGIARGSLVLGPAFNAVLPGSLIVIYNEADKDPNVPADDPSDSNGDAVYILPGNHASLSGCSNLPSTSNPAYAPCTSTTASWSRISLRNGGDVAQIRKPDGTFYHGFAYGDITSPFPFFPCGGQSFNLGAGGVGSTFAFQCGDWENATNFLRPNVTGRTPGVANSPENLFFISYVLDGTLDYNDLNNIQNCSGADLQLTKTVNNSNPNEGDNITFTINITNNGPSAATAIEVEDVIPSDFTYISSGSSQGTINYNSGTNTLTWDLGSFNLTNGNTISLQYAVRVDVCGEFVNSAEITNSSALDPDSVPGNGN